MYKRQPLLLQAGVISASSTILFLGKCIAFAIVAMGLDLIWGYAGILSVSYTHLARVLNGDELVRLIVAVKRARLRERHQAGLGIRRESMHAMCNCAR